MEKVSDCFSGAALLELTQDSQMDSRRFSAYRAKLYAEKQAQLIRFPFAGARRGGRSGK